VGTPAVRAKKAVAARRALNSAGKLTPQVGALELPIPERRKPGRPRNAPIVPHDLLLAAMRASWDRAHTLARHIEDLEADLLLLNENRPGQPMTNNGRLAFLLGIEPGVVIPTDRWDAAAAGGKKELERVKGERDKAMGSATDLAVKAAPYSHPKLQNLDQRVSGEIHIAIKKY
jgi:hypothetical protein